MSPTRSTSHLHGLLRGLVTAACLGVAACASGGTGAGGAAPPAEADVAFMRGMIHHHAQAVVMARMAPTHGASPELRRLAARILNSQKTEISLMADWLRDRDEPVPEPAALAGVEVDEAGAGDGEGGGHDGHGAAPGPHGGWDEGPQMPGILSDAKMAKLDAARGEEFDRLFLTYMIDHHRGAVVMVDRLVREPEAAREESVFRLASGIRADQTAEIDRMRRMLREQLFGSGSPR